MYTFTNDVPEWLQKHHFLSNYYGNSITFDKNKDRDWFGSIHDATVLYPHIDKNGNFSAIIYDKYDFKLEKIQRYKADPIFTTTNNLAFFLQLLKEIKNYYILIDIKVDKSELNKITKNR